jgi:transcriptional regulator with XRE-family HTH domain
MPTTRPGRHNRTRPRRNIWMTVRREGLAGAMTRRGVSVRGLAAACGVSHSMIQQLRSGARSTCSPGLAALIAQRLDVPPGLLFAVHTSSTAGQNIQREEAVSA